MVFSTYRLVWANAKFFSIQRWSAAEAKSSPTNVITTEYTAQLFETRSNEIQATAEK